VLSGGTAPRRGRPVLLTGAHNAEAVMTAACSGFRQVVGPIFRNTLHFTESSAFESTAAVPCLRLLVLLLHPEDVGDISLRKIYLSAAYKALMPTPARRGGGAEARCLTR
jgi:hypothetical protein